MERTARHQLAARGLHVHAAVGDYLRKLRRAVHGLSKAAQSASTAGAAISARCNHAQRLRHDARRERPPQQRRHEEQPEAGAHVRFALLMKLRVVSSVGPLRACVQSSLVQQ